MTKVTKAVIPVAGLATRFLPATKTIPKHMFPIVDKPILQLVVEELVESGITDIIFVTGPHTKSIEDYFDFPTKELITLLENNPDKKHLLEKAKEVSRLANFIYIRQKGPHGNGTPILNAKSVVGNEPFIVKWGDDLLLGNPSATQQTIDIHQEFGCSVLSGIRATTPEDYQKYGFAGGLIIRDGIIDVNTIIEKPGSKDKAPSDLATLSPFLFTPDIFEYLEKAREKLPVGAEFYWNDALKLMLADSKRIISFAVAGGRYVDTGSKLGYLKAIVEFGLKNEEVGDEFAEFLKETTHA